MSALVADFPPEIDASLRQVRDQCGAIIEAVCGTGARAKDVADQFGVHSKLGWQFWNVAYSPPFTALRFLPNAPGMKAWRDAAARKGVPKALLDQFQESVEGLGKTIDLHASDREMFEMILDSNTPDEDAEIRWRKQAFIGNSFIFGAQARCMLSTAILFPSERPGYLSMVRINGLIDLIRTRVGVRWPFAKLVVQHDDENALPRREPLDLDAKVVPLLKDYCSKPLPGIDRRANSDTVSDELLPGIVGLTGASTIFTGEILHELGPVHAAKPGEIAYFGTGIRTPSELLISDHIVHKSIFPGVSRELRVYSDLVSPITRDERDRLDVCEKLDHLGSGLLRVRTADVPDYADLLTESFHRIGLDPADFDVYRVRMRYPPMPASVMVRHAIPMPAPHIPERA